MFFVAAALLLVTAGVFAGKSKFFTNYGLYAYSTSTGYVAAVTGTVGFVGTVLQYSSSATPFSVSDVNSNVYTFYTGTSASGTLYPVFLQ